MTARNASSLRRLPHAARENHIDCVYARSPPGKQQGYPVHGLPLTAIRNRSEERRVGKEGVSTCISRWSLYHKKTNKCVTLREQNNYHQRNTYTSYILLIIYNYQT